MLRFGLTELWYQWLLLTLPTCLCHLVQAEEEARRNRLMRDMAQLRLQVFVITLLTDCSVLILSPVNLYEDTPCDLQSHLPFFYYTLDSCGRH